MEVLREGGKVRKFLRMEGRFGSSFGRKEDSEGWQVGLEANLGDLLTFFGLNLGI